MPKNYRTARPVESFLFQILCQQIWLSHYGGQLFQWFLLILIRKKYFTETSDLGLIRKVWLPFNLSFTEELVRHFFYWAIQFGSKSKEVVKYQQHLLQQSGLYFWTLSRLKLTSSKLLKMDSQRFEKNISLKILFG